MAILEAVRPGSKKAKKKNLEGIIGYVLNPEKTEILHLADGVNVSVHKALDQMRLTKKYYGKTDGRDYYHWVISFPPGEINKITGKPVTPEDVLAFGKRFVEECEITHRGRKDENGNAAETKVKPFEGFESLLAVHTDHDHLHVHIINNSVSLMDGTKFQYSINDLAQMKRFKDTLSEELGWQKEPKKGYTKDGVKREGLASGKSRRYRTMKRAEDKEAENRRDEKEKPKNNGSYVDFCKNLIEYHARHAKSREEFLHLMEEDGYECEWSENRKNVVFTCVEEREKGRANPKIRLSRFADEFNSDFFSKEGLESAFEKNAKLETAINTVAAEIVRTEEIAPESTESEQETAEKPELEESLEENGYENVIEPETEEPTNDEIIKNENHLSIDERYLIQNPVDPNAPKNPKVDLAGVMQRKREETENQRKPLEQKPPQKQNEEAQETVSSEERKPENIIDFLDSLDEPGNREKISEPLPTDDWDIASQELKEAGIPVAESKNSRENQETKSHIEAIKAKAESATRHFTEEDTKSINEEAQKTVSNEEQKSSQVAPVGWEKREDGVLVSKHGFDMTAALNDIKTKKESKSQPDIKNTVIYSSYKGTMEALEQRKNNDFAELYNNEFRKRANLELSRAIGIILQRNNEQIRNDIGKKGKFGTRTELLAELDTYKPYSEDNFEFKNEYFVQKFFMKIKESNKDIAEDIKNKAKEFQETSSLFYSWIGVQKAYKEELSDRMQNPREGTIIRLDENQKAWTENVLIKSPPPKRNNQENEHKKGGGRGHHVRGYDD